MNWTRVLELFRDELLRVNASEGTFVASNIAVPNIAFDSREKNIWFEIAIAPASQIWKTETERERSATISCVICVPQNSDHKRINNIADRIERHFIEPGGGHRILSSEYGTLYIEEVEQMPPIVVNEIYKLNVRLQISI